MISAYRDPKQVREVFCKAFGMACKVLRVKLNDGYDENIEFEETQDSFKELASGRKAERDNLRKFEDDVLTYLIMKSSEYVSSPGRFEGRIGKSEVDIYHCVNSVNTNREKARVLQCNADYRFFGMASGFVSVCDKEKACSAACYRGASAFFEEREGRDSQKAQVLDKLGVNFQRYFVITKEVFEESLTRVDISKDLGDIDLKFNIDELLEELNNEKDPDRKLSLLAKLKQLSSENNDLGNLF